MVHAKLIKLVPLKIVNIAMSILVEKLNVAKDVLKNMLYLYKMKLKFVYLKLKV